MSFTRYILKIKLMDDLIRRKSTGNQATFCRKVSMSRSLLNNYIKEMKNLGFPIEYDRRRSSYYYTEEGRMVNCLFEGQLSDTEMGSLTGGYATLYGRDVEADLTFEPNINYLSFK